MLFNIVLIAVIWFVFGFLARCLLKFIVYDIVRQYDNGGDADAKKFWKKRFGRFQHLMILGGVMSIPYIVMYMDRARWKGDPVRWRFGLKL